MISLLRHNQTVQREKDGAIEFNRIKFYLRNHSSQVQHWSDDLWIACLAAGGGSKRRYQYCSDNSGRNLYLRALQGHSGNNLIDPTLRDNVVIGSGIFHYIYHIGCAFNLHSIINNGLIPGGQDLSRRQIVFFLPIDPRDTDHKDPEYIDFSVPRRARYVHSAWKRHQNAVFWVDINLAIREGLTFYQTRSNAIILQGTLPAYCIPKVVRLKTGEVLYERPYLSPRPPPKISLRHDHNWTRGNDQLGSTVEQYFVTKDTSDFRQFNSVACREYTLPRDDPASQPKGWIQGNMRIEPVLEVTTSFKNFKYGTEIRIWSVGKDNSQSWVRISYGTIKYVVDSNQNKTEIPADPQEDQVPQTSIKVVAARSKAKAKPQQRDSVDTTATIPMHERRWIDIEPSEPTLAAYDVSKKVISLLRHNQTVQREKDGAIEFYRIKFYIRNHSSQVQHWSDDLWKACLAAGGGSKRRYQYCSDNSGRILYLRALEGHSGNNLIDPTLQDNVVIGSGIFHYIYHIGCAFNLHSIINNGLIPGGQDLSRRQIVFFLPIDPRDTDHKDPEYIDFSVPRRARYVHSAWKRHQNAVFWVDINLAIREGLSFYQTRSNAIIFKEHFQLIAFQKLKD